MCLPYVLPMFLLTLDPPLQMRPKAFSWRRRWHEVPDEVVCVSTIDRCNRPVFYATCVATPHQSAALTASPQGEAFCVPASLKQLDKSEVENFP